MAKNFDQARREMQRRINQEAARVNRENKRRVDDYNRQVKRRNDEAARRNRSAVDALNKHNRAVVKYNNEVAAAAADQNRRADAQNKAVVRELKGIQSKAKATPVQFTPQEQQLADRVSQAVAAQVDARETDVFLSYARIDGAEVAEGLQAALEERDVSVWFDAVAITLGRSQSLQMDRGLAKARAGVAVLTPAYIAGRFWTDRELGALLCKDTLIPVLHNVSFEEVKQFSGILGSSS